MQTFSFFKSFTTFEYHLEILSRFHLEIQKIKIMAGENGDTNELAQQVNDLKVPSEESAPDEAERSLLQKVIRKGLVENKNDIEVQRKDPKSPLYSVKSFEALNLKPSLLKGVYGT